MNNLEQIKSLFGQHIPCRALIVEQDLWLADPSESAGETAADMMAFGFDIAPLAPANSLKFVMASAMEAALPEATTGSLSQPMEASMVLGAEAPMADAIEVLREKDFFFIQDRRQIIGIVTQANLNHIALSAYAFQTVLAIEHGLDSLIPSYAPRKAWFNKLSKNDRENINNRHNSRKEYNHNSSIFNALMLRDRIKVLDSFGKLREDVVTRETDKLFSKAGEEKDTRMLDHLRNTLAHGGSILDAFKTVEDSLNALHMIEKLAERIWNLVKGREQLWEAYRMTILSLQSTTQTIILNGPEAADTSSLPWPIFAISASNPFDRELSDSSNDERTERLRKAIAKKSTAYWQGKGAAYKNPASEEQEEYFEKTIFAAGLNESTAVKLGKRFGQRAIFVINAETVSAIECQSGSTTRTWLRDWDGPKGPQEHQIARQIAVPAESHGLSD